MTVNKPAGYSVEVELQIVSPSHVDASLQQRLAQIRNELLGLREMQHDARTKVQEALRQIQQSNALRREDFERWLRPR